MQECFRSDSSEYALRNSDDYVPMALCFDCTAFLDTRDLPGDDADPLRLNFSSEYQEIWIFEEDGDSAFCSMCERATWGKSWKAAAWIVE